ncbi:MAG: ParA family protein [Vulcanisaeta sp.]|nr:ParA family protein [Vulcanisaeta sp.]
MTAIITVANMKGGAGKSTVVALLSYGLAKRGKKVLVIDLDPQSHLSSFFIPAEQLEEVSGGSLDLVRFGFGEGGARIREVVFSDGVKIHLVPSGLNYAEDLMIGQAPLTDPLMLYRQFEKSWGVLKVYDYVLIDTAPEPFQPTQWGLYAADYILMPTSLEELSLLGIKMLVNKVLPRVIEVREGMYKGAPWILGVVLNNISRRYKEYTISKVENALTRFIKSAPSVSRYTYPKLFFEARIYSNYYLSRLPHTPSKLRIPLDSVMKWYKDLEDSVMSLVSEVELRVKAVEEQKIQNRLLSIRRGMP